MSESRLRNVIQGYRRIRRFLYWLLPPVLLFLIIRQIDLTTLKAHLIKTNPCLFLLGIAGYVLINLVGGLRWNIFLTHYYHKSIALRFTYKVFWIGLVLGWLTPGSLGWDIYRVMASARRYGRYGMNIFIIIVEKFQSTIICLFLIMALYPLVSIHSSKEIISVLHFAYIFSSILLVISAAIMFAFRYKIFSLILSRIERSFSDGLAKMGKRLGLKNTFMLKGLSFKEMLKPLWDLKCTGKTFVLSFLMTLAGAIGNYFFFLSIGFYQPLLNHLFAEAIFSFIFRLPISFGGFGIREGAYILVYGLFGLPAESSLLICLYTTFSFIVNAAIGSGVMFFSAFKRANPLEIHENSMMAIDRNDEK
jgi:hypothetical protein